MAIVSIYIPDSEVDRVFNAILQNHNYQGPDSTESFVNQVIRNFLQEHVKAYEVTQARKAAEQAAIENSTVNIADATVATPYLYYMVVTENYKTFYDAIANQLLGNVSFNMPFSADGSEPATHFGLSALISEEIRNKLAAMELLVDSTPSRGVVRLFYVRCDSDTGISRYSNIPSFTLGLPCAFDDVLNAMSLMKVGE